MPFPNLIRNNFESSPARMQTETRLEHEEKEPFSRPPASVVGLASGMMAIPRTQIDRIVRRFRISVNRYARRIKLIVTLYNKVIVAGLRRKQSKDVRKCGIVVDLAVLGLTLSLEISELHDYMMFLEMRKGKYYEQSTTFAMLQNLKLGGTFVDVGANNGYYTLIAARAVGSSGEVIAIEPSPSAFARLERNVRINGLSNVELRRLATSNYMGKAKLFLSNVEDGRNSLVGSRLLHSESYVEVDATTLDAIVRNRTIDLLKIDAEGSELAALQGMDGLIRRSPQLKVILEWNRMYSGQELFDEIQSRFDIYRIDDWQDSYRIVKVTSSKDLPWICNLWLERKGDPGMAGTASRLSHQRSSLETDIESGG